MESTLPRQVNPMKNKAAPKITSEDLAEHKLLMQKAREDLDTFFEDANWKYSEVENVIAYYWADQRVGGLWKQEAWEYWNKGELNSRPFRLPFINATKEQFSDTISMMGELSRLAAMSPYSQSDRGYDLFEDRTPHFFLKNFYEWGFGIICGAPNSGKSAWACRMMEMALLEGFAIITNIWIENCPKEITYVRSFKELLVVCIRNLLQGRQTLIFLDETAQFFKKKRAMSAQYVGFESVLFLLRKVGGNLVSIFQLPKDIPPVIEQFSDAYYQKLQTDRLLYKFKGRVHKIAGVPNTTLEFVTRDAASFILEDVDVDGLRSHLAGLPPGINQLEAILAYLERSKREISETEERIAISVMLRKGTSQKEIAKTFGVTQGRISQIIKEHDLNSLVEDED